MPTISPYSDISTRRNFGRKQCAGFTLIELLVVVSIIVLLIAILLPSLSSAREQAKSAVCKAHLSQIGVAFTGYQAENYGNARPGTQYTVTTSATYSVLVHWNFSQIADLTNPPATYSPMGGYLTQRMNSVAVLQCPSFLNIAADYTGISCAYQADGALGAAKNQGAVPNVYLDGGADTLAYAEAASLNPDPAYPHSLVQLTASYMDQPSNYHPTFHGRHLGKGNVAWCDGHVTSEQPFVRTVAVSNATDYTNFKIGYVTPLAQNTSQIAFLTALNKDYYFWADKNAQN